MTLQEERQAVMEMAVMGVVSQGGPSMAVGGHCVYSSRGGRHCHIGFFVGLNVGEEPGLAEALEGCPLLWALGLSFVEDLQRVHDGIPLRAWTWDGYASRLDTFCSCWGLRFPGELV